MSQVEPQVGQEFLTTEDLAALLRTSAGTCRYWRHVGTGPSSFKVGRRVLYARSDVEVWIAKVREEQNQGVA